MAAYHGAVLPFNNLILRELSVDSVSRLQLSKVDLEVGHQLENTGDEITNLYFIEAGLGSMTSTFHDGHEVEVNLFGCESVIGVSAFMGTKRSLNRTYMQASGYGFKSSLHVAEREYRRYETFHEFCLRYVQTQLLQAAQNAACNATHEVEQRLARWLLLARDRLRTEQVPLSHEYLSHMLGSRRATVTMAAGELQRRGLIQLWR
ncbi:MAG TPA: Crp/Fnr family transcriptional regulator, partial [Terriglobales bacterium]